MSDETLTWADLAALTSNEAAALLIDRWEAGEADDALVDGWLAESADNRAAWSRARDAWDALEGWERAPGLVAMHTAALAARRERPAWTRWAVAAGIAVAVSTAAVLGVTQRRGGGDVVATADLHRFGAPDFVAGANPLGAELPDGTRVRLAPGSALDVAFSADARLARLERGSATFDIRHETTPFRVAAGGRVVTDLGTLFTLDLAPAGLRVRLLRGSVRVARGNNPAVPPSADAVTLHPGQELVARGARDQVGAAVTAVPSPAPMLTFNDEPLSRVVAQMNRYDGVRLVVADPQVAALRISGSFHAGDARRFARTLAALYPATSRTTANGEIIIVSAK